MTTTRRVAAGGLHRSQSEGGMQMERLEEGARRRYHITEECNGCGVCVEWAPDNIAPAWNGSHCSVVSQPANPREERDLHDAEMACPLACLHSRRIQGTARERARSRGR
jgi:ferredoxin